MFVHFRKRLGKEKIDKINEVIVEKALCKMEHSGENESSDEPEDDSEQPVGRNKGKLIVDATCAPADINEPAVNVEAKSLQRASGDS